ncbi:hypothetical protein FSP39_020847 [Pinctada imbricata]|uniref:Ion transport domain-containing protein n=1 Tax=Pinctada imbricata TaxID=66713 RepID=A0AA88XGH4_PINIB|nr:hypothetical protein FSP39_020847 [Pinctada imbricata]
MFFVDDGEYDIVNESGNMGYGLPSCSGRVTNRKLWELNYQEAAIFLQEGENNDKYNTHPRSHEALPAYQMAHHKLFYLMDLFAALLVLFLAACEQPAVPFLMLPVGVHGSLEIFGQLILGLELGIRIKWLGLKTFFTHKRTMIKYFTTIQDSFISLFILLTTANYPDVMMPAYTESRWNAAFFIVYLALELYFLMNLLLAVVYDTFSNLEKRKVKTLFFHKRVGCQHAFKLLVTKKELFITFLSEEHFITFLSEELFITFLNEEHFITFLSEELFITFLSEEHFITFLKEEHFITFLSEELFITFLSIMDCYLIFKCLNKSKSGMLSLEEFYEIYEYLDLQWKTKLEEMEIWSSKFKEPLKKAFQKLYDFVNWKWFDYFISAVIAANFVWILVETAKLSNNSVDVRSYNFTATWASVVFICIYTLEATLKILAKGPQEYFTTGWDVFDFLVTFTSVIGLLGAYFDTTFYYITVLRPFRLLSLMVVICLVYYFFAIIGMEVFHNVNLRNCCKNTSVEDFYQYTNETNYLGYYYLNNFDNILISGVTLFELTVVNNWFIIMEGYAHHVSPWARIYFMLFYLVMMVVMTIVVAFILEMFLFRIQYRRQLKLDDFEDNAKQKVHIYLSNEEKTMCEHPDHVISGQYIALQADEADKNVSTNYIYLLS